MKKIIKKTLITSLASLTLLSASSVFAETVPGTDFNLHLESSNIIGSGRSINIHRVPVVIDSTGETLFFDASFKLSLDSDKQLVFDGFTQVTSPNINSVDNFVAGTYQDIKGNKYLLSGPSVIADGRTGWALSTTEIAVGSNFTLSWITGSVSGHPSIGSRDIVSELPDGFAYGVQGTNENSRQGGGEIRDCWTEGGIIGAQQIGDTLVLSSFHSCRLTSSVTTPSGSLNLIRVIN